MTPNRTIPTSAPDMGQVGETSFACPPDALYQLTCNGDTRWQPIPETAARRRLRNVVMSRFREGWQVQTWTPNFAHVWRHDPAEMQEWALVRVDEARRGE